MTSQADMLAMLQHYRTDDPAEATFVRDTIAFVARHPAFWQRTTLEGHLTGSAWVLSADGNSALLIHHKKLQAWLQPGGHADATDDSLLDTARRELYEECSLTNVEILTTSIFDIDVHPIPAKGSEPAHLHYDIRFLFKAAPDTTLALDLTEVNQAEWRPLDSLTGADTARSIARMALKSIPKSTA
jgi:8-oxo-dGTP pyrophosphatase MutT (NUDIX family)